jgi:hypothetical protein
MKILTKELSYYYCVVNSYNKGVLTIVIQIGFNPGANSTTLEFTTTAPALQ